MSACACVGCFSKAANQKCARCHSVEYCNLDCQKLDWKRHKKYCKPMSDPVGAVAVDTKAALVLAPESFCRIDLELFKLVRHSTNHMKQYPKTVKQELPVILDKLRPLLLQGARPDVRVRLQDGAAALRQAAVSDPDPLEMSSLTATCYLCWQDGPGPEALLKALLTADLSPPNNLYACVKDGRGRLVSPLYCAIVTLQRPTVQLLLEHSVDLKQPVIQLSDGVPQWPVESCLWLGSLFLPTTTDVLELLLRAGAGVDAHQRYDNGAEVVDSTPLVNMLERLTKRRPDSSEAAVHPSTLAILLIKAGADLNARNTYNWRPLDLAAVLTDLTIFNCLVAHGVDMSPVAFICETRGVEHGDHYLQFAVRHGRADVLRAAAAAGIDLKKVVTMGSDSMPLLAYSICTNQISSVRFLLEYGVDVNQVIESMTPGADGKPQKGANHALDLALWFQHTEIIDALRAAGATSCKQALQAQDADISAGLVSQKAEFVPAASAAESYLAAQQGRRNEAAAHPVQEKEARQVAWPWHESAVISVSYGKKP